MNILDFKRKALGYTFRSADGASAADRGYTPSNTDEFIWVSGGTGDNEQLVQIRNPNFGVKTEQELSEMSKKI